MRYKKYLFLIIFCFVIKPGFGQVDPAMITITPQSQTVYGLDNPVSVTVGIEDVSGLFAISITLSFDNSIIKCQNIVQGDFLNNNSGNYNTFFETFPDNLNSADSVIVDQSILGRTSVSGTGELFTITFLPAGVGKSTVKVTSFSLRDLNNVEIPAIADSAEIIVELPVVNTKIFLEGPFLSGTMLTDLNSSGYLPLAQPYSADPWNYTGAEEIDNNYFSTHPDIVDWVLIQLRTDISEGTTAATRSAFLKSDGVVVDTDGISPVSFSVSTNDEYYIVIKHRNHLSVMSSEKISVSGATPLYDFTTGQDKAYGTDPMIDLDGGVFGTPTGDVDFNGIIDALDRGTVWNDRNLSGYNISDVNLNGLIDAIDRGIIWNNRNFSTQVP